MERMISLGRGTRACGNPGSFPGLRTRPRPRESLHARGNHVRLIALLANNLDVKWVMGQVGHADAKMTMDVYAQLEQRAFAWQHLGNSRSVRCVQAAMGARKMEDANPPKRTYGQRARFRSVWMQVRGGSSPLIRIRKVAGNGSFALRFNVLFPRWGKGKDQFARSSFQRLHDVLSGRMKTPRPLTPVLAHIRRAGESRAEGSGPRRDPLARGRESGSSPSGTRGRVQSSSTSDKSRRRRTRMR